MHKKLERLKWYCFYFPRLFSKQKHWQVMWAVNTQQLHSTLSPTIIYSPKFMYRLGNKIILEVKIYHVSFISIQIQVYAMHTHQFHIQICIQSKWLYLLSPHTEHQVFGFNLISSMEMFTVVLLHKYIYEKVNL